MTNWSGMAAGFKGYQDGERAIADEERRKADEARRVKMDARADTEAAFQEEARSRQRYDWKEVDRIKAADKKDMAEIREQLANEADAVQGGANPVAAEGAPAADKIQAEIDKAMAPAPAAASLATLPTPKKMGAIGTPAGTVHKGDFNSALEVQTAFLRRKNARGDLTLEELAQKQGLLTKIRTRALRTHSR